MTNLLFVTLDDFLSLSAWPVYDGIAITPNMDALQASSANFNSAFADVALCNPSRAAILTGKTPWETGVLTNTQDLRHHVDVGSETLPAILKAAGMYTAVGGKVYHTFPTDQRAMVADEVLNSHGLRNSNAPEYNEIEGTHYGTTTETLSDDVLTDSVTDFLANYAGDDPFAVFAGIYRPHVDWIIPQEYLDLYADIDVPLPDFVDDQDRADFLAALNRPFHAAVLENGAWEDMVRHYLASMTYADAKLGEMMAALQASDHAENTVTVVLSDHGYHLGDAEMWHKFSTYEQSARAPLVISVPGAQAREIDTPVNLSGVTATVLELLGVDVPEGMQPALTPLLEGVSPSGTPYALTWMNASVSVRTAEYRYVLYENGEEELFEIDTDVMNTDNLVQERPGDAAAMRQIAEDAIGDTLFIRPDGPVSGGAEDTVYYLQASEVEITDSGGIDTVYFAGDYSLQGDLENLHAIESAHGVTLIGNLSDNRISGAQDNDLIQGRAGADFLFGSAGADTVDGGPGNDFVSGGPGRDFLTGGDGHDRIEGNFGDDTLRGGSGNDDMNGSQGDDFLYGNEDNDVLDGSAGNDRAEGGQGHDTLIGGEGWDLLIGGRGIDTAVFSGNMSQYRVVSGNAENFQIEGPDGRDVLIVMELLQFDDMLVTVEEFLNPTPPTVLIGTTSDDLLETGSGGDELVGRSGRDTLHSGSGDDLLKGGDDDDILDGGFGNDTASYQGATNSVEAYLNFGLSRGAHGEDRLYNIENLIGGEHDDWLVGNDGENRLDGLRGNDILRGKEGNDTLYGLIGDDKLEGDGGNDLLYGGDGSDSLYGGSGADQIYGGNGHDYFEAGDDRDLLVGGHGNDTMFAGQHNDTLSGGTGDDLLRGNRGNDDLDGGNGDDNLRGGNGNDVLIGGTGNDALFGEAGEDRLVAGIGNDVLNGGIGGGEKDLASDTFVFGTEAQGFGGFNRIRDFENGIDVLDLSGFQFTDFSLEVLSTAAIRGDGNDLGLLLGSDYVVYIDNFTLAEFDLSDVIL